MSPGNLEADLTTMRLERRCGTELLRPVGPSTRRTMQAGSRAPIIRPILQGQPARTPEVVAQTILFAI
jgi:hypothetical protein